MSITDRITLKAIEIILFFFALRTKAQATLQITQSTQGYANFAEIEDVTTMGPISFLMSRTQIAYLSTGTDYNPTLTKNSTQANFASLDCNLNYCLIGATNSEIYYYNYKKKSGSYDQFIFENLKTFKPNPPQVEYQSIYLIRMLDKAYNDNVYFLAAKNSKWGVFKFALTETNSIGVYRKYGFNYQAPTDLVFFTRTRFAAVTHPGGGVEIFDITTMLGVKTYTDSSLIAYIDYGNGIIVGVSSDKFYGGLNHMNLFEIGESYTTGYKTFDNPALGVSAFRSSIFFTILFEGEIHFYEAMIRDPATFLGKHSLQGISVGVNGLFSKKNNLVRNEYYDQFGYMSKSSGGLYFLNDIKVSLENIYLNPACSTGSESFTSKCSVCAPNYKKVGELCVQDSYGKDEYSELSVYTPPNTPTTKTLEELAAEQNNGATTTTTKENDQTPTEVDEDGKISTSKSSTTSSTTTSTSSGSSSSSSSGGSSTIIVIIGVFIALGIGASIIAFTCKPKPSLKTQTDAGVSKNSISAVTQINQNNSVVYPRGKIPENKILQPPMAKGFNGPVNNFQNGGFSNQFPYAQPFSPSMPNNFNGGFTPYQPQPFAMNHGFMPNPRFPA